MITAFIIVTGCVWYAWKMTFMRDLQWRFEGAERTHRFQLAMLYEMYPDEADSIMRSQ